ncbi:MAG: YqeG family HAD IIIA-type phosphatase [Bacilli bacterium]|nr:YqeG family HAD IIIA-type phosphatase [Bacilli bacterium]
MDRFIPDVYQKSIYTINYEKLKKNGIKCLLFDLDNTMVSYKTNEPDTKLKELFTMLGNDFKIIIISNSNKNRLRPFKEKLNVDVAFKSRKPLKTKYKKILDIYKFKMNEIACIGDQLLTDILGANRMGFTSILVNRIAQFETLPTKINRFFEKFIMKRLAKKHILVSGEYYD